MVPDEDICPVTSWLTRCFIVCLVEELSLSYCQWLLKILKSSCSVSLLFHSASPHCLLTACTASAEVASYLIARTASPMILRTGHTRPLLARQLLFVLIITGIRNYVLCPQSFVKSSACSQPNLVSAVSETIHKDGNCGVSGKSGRGEGDVWNRRWTRGACRVAFDPLPARSSYSTFRQRDHRIMCVFVWGEGFVV
jgi:hypothetical protein